MATFEGNLGPFPGPTWCTSPPELHCLPRRSGWIWACRHSTYFCVSRMQQSATFFFLPSCSSKRKRLHHGTDEIKPQTGAKTIANSLGFRKIRVTATNKAAMMNSDFQKDITNYCDVALSLSLWRYIRTHLSDSTEPKCMNPS